MSNNFKYKPIEGEIFHVHTYRCGHAEDIQDEEYVKKAIELGASRIVFTDHAPFPGNPLGNRMDIEQLPEYVETIGSLKKKYLGQIEILCGLEIEYFPSFEEYYISLKELEGIDLLILGQHLYEINAGEYSISLADKSDYYIGLCEAMEKGIKTGFFDVVAHPDRAFRARKSFGDEERKAAMKVHAATKAVGDAIYLEKNFASMNEGHYYWPEFWEMFENYPNIIYGYDAHSIEEIEAGWTFFNE